MKQKTQVIGWVDSLDDLILRANQLIRDNWRLAKVDCTRVETSISRLIMHFEKETPEQLQQMTAKELAEADTIRRMPYFA